MKLPFADAKVAASLCVGGPIKYAPVEDSGITEDWLASQESCTAYSLAIP